MMNYSSGWPTNTGLKKMKGLEPHPFIVYCETTRADFSVAWVCPLRPHYQRPPLGCILGKGGNDSRHYMSILDLSLSFQKPSCKLVHLLHCRHHPQGDHVSSPPPYTWLLTVHNEGTALDHPEDARVSFQKSDQDWAMGPSWDLTYDLVLP